MDRTWGLAWNPVEPVLASCGADKNVRLHRYRFVSGAGAGAAFQTQTTLDTGHGRTVRALTWTPDGMVLATASFDSTIGVWEPVQEYEEGGEDAHAAAGLGEWECVGTLEGHDSEVKGVAFSYDGTLLASCSRDKSVWVWETQPDSEFECLSVLMEHSQDVKAVAWHPREELLASASYDDTIKLYADDPSDDWFVVQTLQGHTSTVWSIAFSPDGAFLASASDDRTVRIWRRLTEHQAQLQGLPATKRWQCTNVLRGWHTRPILSISWSNTSTGAKDRGLIASTGSDGNIVVYQVVSICALASPTPFAAPFLTSLFANPYLTLPDGGRGSLQVSRADRDGHRTHARGSWAVGRELRDVGPERHGKQEESCWVGWPAGGRQRG